MVSNIKVDVCPEQAREVILDWLSPWTDQGGMDALCKAVAMELVPYAQVAARKVLRTQLGSPPAEVTLLQVRGLLDTLLKLVENCTLNPDMAAVNLETHRELMNAENCLRDWICFLDHRDSEQATVHPDANTIMLRGGVQ